MKGGSVDQLYLTYSGNPFAVRKVFERWREVFRAAGAECSDDGLQCDVANDSGTHANAVSRRDRWWGSAEVNVEIFQ